MIDCIPNIFVILLQNANHSREYPDRIVRNLIETVNMPHYSIVTPCVHLIRLILITPACPVLLVKLRYFIKVIFTASLVGI